MRLRIAYGLAAAGAIALLVGSFLDWVSFECYVLRGYGASSYEGLNGCAWSLWRVHTLEDIWLAAAAVAVVGLGGLGILRQRGSRFIVPLLGLLIAPVVAFDSPLEYLVYDVNDLGDGGALALVGAAALLGAVACSSPWTAERTRVTQVVLVLVAVAAPLANLAPAASGQSIWEAQRTGDLIVLATCVPIATWAITGRGSVRVVAAALGLVAGAALTNGLELIAIEHLGDDVHVGDIGAGAWINTCAVAPLAMLGAILVSRHGENLWPMHTNSPPSDMGRRPSPP